MKINNPKLNWMLDASLLLGFLLAFWLDLTGLTLHQWLGVALAVGAALHVLIHWNWVKSVTRRFFGRTSGQARLFYLVDFSLLVSFFLVALTGLVISTWLELDLANDVVWKDLHVFSSITALLVVVLKVALHWRWIRNVAGRYFSPPRIPALRPVPGSLVAVPVNTERRDFLRLMGVVSVAALVSIAHVVDSDEQTFASASAEGQDSSNLASTTQATEPVIPAVESSLTASKEDQDVAATSATPSEAVSGIPETENNTSSPESSSLLSLSASPCRVECDRRCSYPGHCRRYVDSNGNNRCDHGECM